MRKKLFYVLAMLFTVAGANFYQGVAAEANEEQTRENTQENSQEEENLDSPWDPRG